LSHRPGLLPLQLAALRCAGKEVEKLIEVGTLLTSNHGHAAMFGVFGMLALAVLVFCLRSMQTDAVWQGTVRYIRIGSGDSTRVWRSWSSPTCSLPEFCSYGTR
jgi:hypothetical protein